MALIFDVFFDILAKWEKLAEKNMFFERSIFNDFLDGQKSRSQGSYQSLGVEFRGGLGSLRDYRENN